MRNQDAYNTIKAAAKAVAASVAGATAPMAPLRINPLVALNPRPRPLTGRELAFVRTQKRDGLTYRAGRSKYAPKELKQAVARARTGRLIHNTGLPFVNWRKLLNLRTA